MKWAISLPSALHPGQFQLAEPGRALVQGPEPFAWTKTADEIPQTLAACCQRITGPGR